MGIILHGVSLRHTIPPYLYFTHNLINGTAGFPTKDLPTKDLEVKYVNDRYTSYIPLYMHMMYVTIINNWNRNSRTPRPGFSLFE